MKTDTKSKSKGRNSTKTTTTTNNNNVVVGKGKVTPVQVAFIVDRYLSENNFTATRSSFHSEASNLISKASLNQVPKLMSLGELLDEYIWLKGQKLIIEQEKCGLAQERIRIQTLLKGMQDVMNGYNSAAVGSSLTPPPPPTVDPPVSVPLTSMPNTSSAGIPASKTPAMTSVSMTQSVKINHSNYVTPIPNNRHPRKRRINYNTKDLENVPHAPKKIYSGPLANYPFSNKGSSVNNTVGLPNPESSLTNVAKDLFDKPPSSSIPKTPPKSVSTLSDKSVSPLEDISSVTPTSCTIISSKTTILSPSKGYSIERNECTFSSPAKRVHVKGRLDFDTYDLPSSSGNASGEGSTSSESEKGDVFDLDLSRFDVFGPDFALTELLTEFGFDSDNLDYSFPTTACGSFDAPLELYHERNSEELVTCGDMIEHSSAENIGNGSDSMTSVKSIRQCITIVSPGKKSRDNSVQYQENQC